MTLLQFLSSSENITISNDIDTANSVYILLTTILLSRSELQTYAMALLLILWKSYILPYFCLDLTTIFSI